MTNTHIQTAIQKVSTSFPSLFSREDVIKLLMDLSAEMQDEGPKPKIDLDILLTTFRQVLSEKDWDDVVDKDDIDGFAEKLWELIENENKRQLMSQNGWSFVEEKFQYPNLMKNMDEYYKSLLKEMKIWP